MWRSDHDIFQTFEGDNTVLLQQVCRSASSDFLGQLFMATKVHELLLLHPSASEGSLHTIGSSNSFIL